MFSSSIKSVNHRLDRKQQKHPVNTKFRNLYLGVGLVLASEDKSSTVGNKISFALQPGVDYIIPNSNTVIFGNAIIAFDSYRNRSSNAFSIQGGVSWRF